MKKNLALAILLTLLACNQPPQNAPSAQHPAVVLGMGEIPFEAGLASQAPSTQALSTDVTFTAADPSDGAGIDFSVDTPSDIVFDDVNNVNYIRTRVRVTNNTGTDIQNLTLMGIAPRASSVTALSRLRDLVGEPLSQLEAFNSDEAVDPTAVNPQFIPSPTHAVTIADNGEITILENRADFVAYEEDPTAGSNRVGENELQPVIDVLNDLAANNPAFGLVGENGINFSLLPYGFQVGDLPTGAEGFVDVTFSIPNDPLTNVQAGTRGVSPLARFAYTFVAVQDSTGRVTQAVEEIDLTGDVDSGLRNAEQRFLNPAVAASDLSNVTNLALLGSAERDVTVPQSSVVCIPNVRVSFGIAATIFDTTQNAAAAGLSGECTLNDASAFALAAAATLGDQQVGEAFTDINNDGFTVTLSANGQPVVGREVEVIITSAPDGVPLAFNGGTTSLVTDENGQVTFGDLVLNNIGDYTIQFVSGGLTTVTETITVEPGPVTSYILVYTDANGADIDDAVFPADFFSTEAITGDADPNTDGIQPAFLAIRGVDAFGNQVDLGGTSQEVYVSVVLLQNGNPVADNPVIGFDDGGDSTTNPYPQEDDTVAPAIDPILIQFATAAANPGTFVFNGNETVAGSNLVDAGDIADSQTAGALLRVTEGGNGYQLQFSFGTTINELATAPIVATTPEFSVTPAAASVILVRPDIGGNKVGETITDVAGNPLRVRIVDENGNPVAGREVRAQVIAGDTENGDLQSDFGSNFDGLTPEHRILFDVSDQRDVNAVNLTVPPFTYAGGFGGDNRDRINGVCFYYFATDNERGAGAAAFSLDEAAGDPTNGVCGYNPFFIANGETFFRNVPYAAAFREAPGAAEEFALGYQVTGISGQRIVTAFTNANGEATFSGDNALVIGAPGTNYRIQFSVDDGRILANNNTTYAINHTTDAGGGNFVPLTPASGVNPGPNLGGFTMAEPGDPFNSITSNAFNIVPGDVAEVRVLVGAAPTGPGDNDGTQYTIDFDARLNAPTFGVSAAPRYVRVAGGDFTIGLYDKFGNRVSNFASQVLVSKLPTGGNNLYGVTYDGTNTTAIAAEAGRTFDTAGGGAVDGHTLTFSAEAFVAAGDIGLSLTDSTDNAFTNAAATTLPGTVPDVSAETNLRLQFRDLASGTIYTTPLFDIP